jgi:site-specific DNA recombinase
MFLLRAAAYARYSTDHQTENSIAYQLNGIEDYCKKHNITISRVFKDEALSGTNVDRKGFIDMIEAAKRNEFDSIIIYDISRGSRDVADWFNFRKVMYTLNVQIISVEDKLGDITNPSDFLTELITVGLGQHQVLSTRQKSMAGVAVKAKEGVFLGGFAPLGYDIVDGQYIINEREAPVVRSIFGMYAAGDSYNIILDEIKGIHGKRGQSLGKNSLYSILTNERYIGIYTWNQRKMKLMGKWAGGMQNPDCVRIENAIPIIIDQEIWERVQIRLKSNKKATNKAKQEYLLSGLIECEECGSSYVGHCSTNPRGYKTRYYCCGNKYRTRECSAKNINADEIETFVVQNLKAYLLQSDFEDVAQRIADAVNNAAPDLSVEKKEIADITKKIANGVKAVLSGMEFPELESELLHLRVRKSELEDIVLRKSSNQGTVDKDKIVKVFEASAANWDTDLKNIRLFVKCCGFTRKMN